MSFKDHSPTFYRERMVGRRARVDYRANEGAIAMILARCDGGLPSEGE